MNEPADPSNLHREMINAAFKTEQERIGFGWIYQQRIQQGLTPENDPKTKAMRRRIALDAWLSTIIYGSSMIEDK